MANELTTAAQSQILEAQKAEAHRIRERLRQIAYGYRCANLTQEELIIRRAIDVAKRRRGVAEEIFDPVLEWEDPDTAAAKVRLKVRR